MKRLITTIGQNIIPCAAIAFVSVCITITAINTHKLNKKIGTYLYAAKTATPIGTVYIPSMETDAIHAIGYPFVRCERTEWQHTFVLTDGSTLTLPVRGQEHYIKRKETAPQVQGK